MKIRLFSSFMVLMIIITIAGCSDVSELPQEGEPTQILLNGKTATVSGDGATILEETIIISKPGNYVLSGQYNGQVKVATEMEGEVILRLSGVVLENSLSVPIYIENADLTTLYLEEDTENFIIDNSAYMEESAVESELLERLNGAIYSKDDLIVNGKGSLEIISAYKSGIMGKDSLSIEAGLLKISGATNGMKANDKIYINGGLLDISAGTDGMDSEGTIVIDSGEINIVAGDDGIHADTYIEINGGVINVVESYEGIESKNIVINDGQIEINSSDDGVNINLSDTEASLTINGGVLNINSYGDGIDSNNSVWMTGGIVYISGPVENMNGAIDYDKLFEMTGGYLVAVGSSGMMQSIGPSSTLNSLVVGFPTMIEGGTLIEVLNGDEEVILSYTAPKSFQSIVFASEDLVMENTYHIEIDGSVYNTFEVVSNETIVGSIGGMNQSRPDRRGGEPSELPPGMERAPSPFGGVDSTTSATENND